MKSALTALILVLTLCGCAQLPLSTAWSMRDIDYLTLDPRVTRLAMALPEGAALDEVVLELSFTLDDKLEIDHRIPFDIVTRGTEVERVGFPVRQTSNVVLRIPADRVEDVAIYQQALMQAREGGLSASASMGVSSKLNPQWVMEYCAAGNNSFKVQAWILVSDLDGYLPLIRESEIMKLLDSESTNLCMANH